ncbi:Retrovirus-related Pol polyprotein from type-1 retrotransposable element R1 4 [Eumeta japonica]|uniref:Retrovirus-related Pol polyprotein from type-1 retrotransposable element R1 4 n=1 Tax=Eumeta variegata TaxID=151549 RepID=A0A4C1UCG1_EUMVA|nr:Retrovirus-related Pol polyprotein from type-1 retrotransposable element R1 4 [Eumeta japonica]
MRYPSLLTVYKGTYVATVTYAAGCWHMRANLHVVRSALLRTQRPALTLLTKAYRTTSTAALPVLAGVLPADYEVLLAGKTDTQRDYLTRAEIGAVMRRAKEEVIDAWQKRWNEETHGRELYCYFPDVSARLSSDWVEPDYETSQLLTGHGSFRKRLHGLGLNESSICMCGQMDEDMHHVLWTRPLYDDIRAEMLSGLEVLQEGPVYYADPVGSRANFRRCRRGHGRWWVCPEFRADVSHAIEVRADGHVSLEVHRHDANSAVSGFNYGSCDVFAVEALILFDVHVAVQDYDGGLDGSLSRSRLLDDSAPWVPSQLADIPNVGFLNKGYRNFSLFSLNEQLSRG